MNHQAPNVHPEMLPADLSQAQSFRPELLSPAGTLKAMRFAFAYGADAVYAGMPRYSLRVRNNEFDLANLAIGIQEAHALGKKLYCVLNSAPHNAKLNTSGRRYRGSGEIRPRCTDCQRPWGYLPDATAFPRDGAASVGASQYRQLGCG